MGSSANTTSTSEDEAVYEVEKIMGHRRSKANKNLVEYLIKWKDYDPIYNTWERETNVYSKVLIRNYWNTQPYTLESFRTNTHQKKGNERKKRSRSSSSSSSASPRKRSATASPSLINSRLERQRLIKEIKASQISASPPMGYTWSDIEAIVNVFHSEPNIYFAEIKWPKQTKTTYIPTRIIKKYNSLKLIHYYETKLEFCLPNGVSK